MRAVALFLSRQQARRCVQFCTTSGVPAHILNGGRLSLGYVEVSFPSQYESLVRGAFYDVLAYIVVYA